MWFAGFLSIYSFTVLFIAINYIRPFDGVMSLI